MKKIKSIMFLSMMISFVFFITVGLTSCGLKSTSSSSSNSTENTELTEMLYSIYQLSTDSGSFNGTYVEWLETVRGPAGIAGTDGREVVFQVAEGYIRWQYTGDSTWNNLVLLSSLVGPKGDQGDEGNDGQEVIFRVSDTHIQWQYHLDTTWNDLIALDLLVGAKGTDGHNGIDGREVSFQVADNFIRWQYIGDTHWNNLVELTSLVGPKGEQGDSGIDGREIVLKVNDTHIQWKYFDDEVWNDLVALSLLIGGQGLPGEQGNPGEAGREVLFQVASGYIQWQYVGDTYWTNLVEINSLVGEQGMQGTPGVDGRELMLQVSDTHIQWKYQDDVLWNDLISLDLLMGVQGNQGLPGTDGREVQFHIADGFIKWQYVGDTLWNNLVELASLVGPQGEQGLPGVNGQEVDLRVNDTHIQWKYHNDTTWNDLIALITIAGKDGIGISSTVLSPTGEIIITYTNGTSESLGSLYLTYLVQFKDHDGRVIDTQYLRNGESATAPVAPDISGYIFSCWDKTFTNISGPLSVSAVYIPESYNITFHTDSDIIHSTLNNITYGSTVSLPVPVKPGYEFVGWYKGMGPNVSPFYNDTIVTSSMDLYAQWEEIDYGFIYDLHEGEVTILGFTGSDRIKIIPETIAGYPVTTIGDGTPLYFNYYISEVVIPQNVTSIAENAFKDAYSLQTVRFTVGSELTSIGSHAFANTYMLSTIAIPNSVSTIGDHAFLNAKKITTLTFSPSVTSIGEGALEGTSSLTALSIPFVGQSRDATGVQAILGFLFGSTVRENCSEVTQPYSLTENKITYIPSSLVSITVTDATSIGYGAFANATMLSNIQINSGVTSIGSYALYQLSQIHDISLPGAISSLPDHVLQGSGIVNLTIPASVTSIGETAFADMTALESFTFEGMSQMQSIGRSAFRNDSSLLSITIPSGVTSIGDSAFYNGTMLSEVIFETGCALSSIEAYLFYEATSLSSITLPSSITSIGNYAFYRATSLLSLSIPAGVTSIGYDAFHYASSLTNVNLESGSTLLTLGNYAFSSTLLSTINLPSTLYNIELNTFFDTPLLSGIHVDAGNTHYRSIDGVLFNSDMSQLLVYPAGSLRTTYVVPDGVTSIKGGSFYKAIHLTDLTISNTVTNFDANCFHQMESLTNLSLPFVGMTRTSTTVLGYLFGTTPFDGGYYALQSYSAYYFPISLQTITITDALTIRDYTFANLRNVQEITFNNGITSIGVSALHSMQAVVSLTIPQSVTNIGASAFANMTSLVDITLPHVGNQRLSATAYALFGFVFGTGVYPGCDATIQYYSSTSYATYYIPSSLRSITITDATTLRYGAFYNLHNVTSITLNSGITTIMEKSFYQVSALSEVRIPLSVQTVGANAFYGSENLVILAEAPSQPVGWDVNWNAWSYPVTWGVSS